MSTSGSDSFGTIPLAGSILEPNPPATMIASSTAAICSTIAPWLSRVTPRGGHMGGNVNWKPLAAVGAILVGFTFTDLSPKGPWNDATFTSGSIGLIGLTMLYMAWFRFTFNREGLVPTMDLWKNPEKTSLRWLEYCNIRDHDPEASILKEFELVLQIGDNDQSRREVPQLS